MSKKLLLAEKKKEDTKPKEQNSTMSAEDIKKINHTAPTKRPDMKIEIVNGAPVISYVGKDPLKKGRLFKDRDLDAEVQRLFGYSSWNEYKKDNKNDLVGPQATVHPIHVALALDEFVRNFRPADYVLVGVPISGQPTEANLKALGLSGLRKGFFGDEKGSQSVSQMGILNSAMFAPAGGLSNVKAITMAKENLGVDEMLDQLKRLKYAVIHPEGGYWSDTRPLGQTRNMSKAIQTRMFSENTEAVMLSEGLGGASKEFLKFLAQGILRIGGRGKELSKAAIRALTGGLDDVGLNILERSKDVLVAGSPKSLKLVNDIIKSTDEQQLIKAITARTKEVLSRSGELHKKDTLRQELEMLLRQKSLHQRGFRKLNLQKKLLAHFDAVADATVAGRTTAAGAGAAAAGTGAAVAAGTGAVATGATVAGTSSLGNVAAGVFIGRNVDKIFRAVVKAKGRLAIGGLTGLKAYNYFKDEGLEPEECLIAAAIFAGAGAFIVPAALKITIGVALASLKYLGGIGLTGYVVGKFIAPEYTDAVVDKLWKDIKKRAQKLVDNWPALASYGIDSVIAFFKNDDIPPMPPAVANALGITDVPTEKPDEKPEVTQTTQKVEGVKQLKMLLLPKRWRDGEYLTNAEKILAQRVGANQATGLMVMSDGERSYEGYLKFTSAIAAKLAAAAAAKANQQFADSPDQQPAKINFGKVLIFGHSQASRYARQLSSKIKAQGGKIVKKVHAGRADKDVGDKKGLASEIKKITGEFTHAYLFLNGNTKANGNLYEEAKRSIIEYTTNNLKVPKQNIVVILPPVNLSDPDDYNLDHVKKYYKQKKGETSEQYNKRLNSKLEGIKRNAKYSAERGEGINKRARTYFEGLGVKVLDPITSTNINDFPDGFHISRLSDVAGSASDKMISSVHSVSADTSAPAEKIGDVVGGAAVSAGLVLKNRVPAVNIIIEEAKKANVDPRLAIAVAAIESNFKSNLTNSDSGASGLFQFLPKFKDYWNKRFKLNWKDRHDARENSKAFMKVIKVRINSLKKKGILKTSTAAKVSDDEAYLIFMAHNQGVAGSTKIWKAATEGAELPAGIKNNMRGNLGSLDKTITDKEMAVKFLNTWKSKISKSWERAGAILSSAKASKQTVAADITNVNLESSTVKEASLWGNGSLKESDPRSWAELGRYWRTVGNLPGGTADIRRAAKYAEAGLLTSLYRGWDQAQHNKLARGGQNYMTKNITEQDIKSFYNHNVKKYGRQLPYGDLNKYLKDFVGTKVPVPYNSFWSAIFINYAMRGEPDFVRHASEGVIPGRIGLMSHRSYIGQAKRNTRAMKKNKDASSVSYVYVDAQTAKRLGYKPVIGDILIAPNGHGDILTSKGKIGGNLSNSVKVATSSTAGIVTKSNSIKQKMLQSSAVSENLLAYKPLILEN